MIIALIMVIKLLQAASTAAAQTMQYMLDFWLHRLSSLRAPPAILLGYLWDKQPSAPFKPGNRALCGPACTRGCDLTG